MATDNVLAFPPVSSEGKPNAHRPARPPARGKEDPPADPAAEGAGGLRGREAARWAGSLASGASLLAAQPPSIAARWDRHRAAAQFYSARTARYARYGWGLWDSYVTTPVLYALAWLGESPVKAGGFGALIVTALALLGVRLHIDLAAHTVTLRL